MNLQERRDRKARQAKAEAATLAENIASDAGRDYFKKSPDLMLVEVSREGSSRFNSNGEIIAFLRGYCEARKQREEFLMESER